MLLPLAIAGGIADFRSSSPCHRCFFAVFLVAGPRAAQRLVMGAILISGLLAACHRPALNGTAAPMFIDDSSSLTVMEMRAKCRRLKAEHGLSLIIVDYLQLMSGYGRTENRNQEISGISRGLKALAKELNVPVIALSQLSRAPEQRQGDHKPQLSDLRESGSIEQDADLVMFIYREEVYKPSEENAGLAELIIAKQRNGPTGIVKLAFLREFTRFETLLDIN